MKPVLLLVDLQNDHLAAPELQPPSDTVVKHAADLLERCRHHCVPVIHVWTTIHRDQDRRLPHWKRMGRWMCVAGTTGYQPPPRLLPQADELVIHKTGFNAFAGTTLDAALQRLDCNTVILAGVQLHTCVRTAAAESLERGLQVFVAEDAVGSNDPVYAAVVRRWLAERYVQFEPVNAVLSHLDGYAPSEWVHRSPRETKKALFEVPAANAEEIATATAAAKNEWTDWRRRPPSFCRARLEKFAEQLEASMPDLARQMAVEIGKPFSHGLEEVRRAAGNVRDVIRRAANFERRTRETAGAVHHQSHGVVAIISPWNNPVAIAIGKIAPALVYGNTVVWKPAPAATEISLAILQWLRNVGIPHDAVQLLAGNHAVARQLAANKNVGAVTLTGSASAGYAIQEICARRFVPLQAELSGNNAAIVWDDADLPPAAAQVAWGAFGFAGQRCTANRRVIVSRKNFGNLLRELKGATQKLIWGDPLKKHTDIGPVIDAGKRDEQVALIRASENSGAAHQVERLFVKRARESWVKAGAYAQPVIVCCDQPGHILVQEETMSPLLVVQRADDFNHALELCNGVRHGLVAALFSNAPELQQKFLAEARAGILKLNAATAGVDASLPFGGWKASGLGPPEHGEGDRLFYTRMQAVYGADDLK